MLGAPLFEIALVAALIGGLAGGVHCAGMCGGIVGALCYPAGGEFVRWRHLFAYNVGRIASYAVAGVLAGALGAAALLTRGAPILQPLTFVLASLMLITMGLSLAGITPIVRRVEVAGAWLWRLIQPWTGRILPVTSLPRAFALGMLWGWLPCGMVYAVLLTALALGSWWQGGVVLLAFGLGTLPNLLGLGLAWRKLVSFKGADAARALAGFAVAGFGVYGLVKAAQPIAVAGDALLCHALPGLGGWLH